MSIPDPGINAAVCTPKYSTIAPNRAEPIGMPPIIPNVKTLRTLARCVAGEASCTIARESDIEIPPHMPQTKITK